MKVLVAYQSQRGHTQQTALAISRAAGEHDCAVVVKRLAEVQPAEVEEADILFVGTWVRGFLLFGTRPAGVKRWIERLPELTDKPVGVFCTYAFNPRAALRALSSMLTARGASVIGERGFHRSFPAEGAKYFVQHILDGAGTTARSSQEHAAEVGAAPWRPI